MPEIKYRVWGVEIKAIECEKSTEKSVWFKNPLIRKPGKTELIRASRTTVNECYFDTWDEAYEYLLEKQKRKVQELKKKTQRENSLLGQIKKMKNQRIKIPE